ncbi:MAG TPA: metallophosphoesterase [Thermoanaerobaculia bacterium]|nr:metallophosphoesterase [Thermoanaerobaculia bacterium]
MIRPLFFALLFLALLGDARIMLFIINRFVFGNRREEEANRGWLLWVVPPLLLVLTLLFWPVHQWIQWLASQEVVQRITPEPIERVVFSILLWKIGSAWLLIAAAVGAYWILDRIRVLRTRVVLPNVRTLPSVDAPFDIEVTQHEIVIPTLPAELDGYRIAFLTDTHVFGRRPFYREVIAQVRDADLVLLGGDFISRPKHIGLMADLLLTNLAARDGIYAVLGNHDYWAGRDEVIAAMTARGVRFIINRSIAIRRGLSLIGIDERYRGNPDIDAAFARVPADSVRLALSHHPDIIDMLDGRHLDLLVCGHTHGGQIRVPFFGAPVVPSRYEQRYARGFHRVGDVLLYVSRGIGGVPPIRIRCRPEVATFVLRRPT